jgi:hypothetical protein
MISSREGEGVCTRLRIIRTPSCRTQHVRSPFGYREPERCAAAAIQMVSPHEVGAY